MNESSSNLTVLHNAEESVVNFEGEIGEIKVNGTRLNDIHDLAVKVEGIRTLTMCMGVILMACLICNLSMAAWVYFH